MADVSRVHPTSFPLDTNFLGKTLSLMDIDFNGDISGKLGPASTVEAVMKAIQAEGFNIVIIGPSHTSDNNISVALEGEYNSDTYDGTNSETVAAHLEDVVTALGTVDSVDLSSATVTAKTFVL